MGRSITFSVCNIKLKSSMSDQLRVIVLQVLTITGSIKFNPPQNYKYTLYAFIKSVKKYLYDLHELLNEFK